MAPPGTQHRVKAQKRKVVSVECQTDTPYHGTGCTSASLPPCEEEYEDATVLRPGSEMTVMTDMTPGGDDDERPKMDCLQRMF